MKMTRLSCHRFRSNQVRLGLSLLAYNLGNLWRRLALPKRIENWSLTSLQQRLVTDVLPAAVASSSGHVSPAVRPFCSGSSATRPSIAPNRRRVQTG
ncbi:MAG: transposase [Candidatus Korobacteraceae bacterium]